MRNIKYLFQVQVYPHHIPIIILSSPHLYKVHSNPILLIKPKPLHINKIKLYNIFVYYK